MIGKAAHICAAAPGRGSRRYDASMTSEERRDINNAIWLCATHADLIDRDEATYTVESLHAMKQKREAICAAAVRSGTGAIIGAGLLAIGPEIVCTGDIQGISASSWTIHLRHFVVGDMHGLISFIGGFAALPVAGRYVLSNELGEGRVITDAPVLTKREDGGYLVLCQVEARFPRVDVQNLGSDMALHPVTRDLYVENGNIARVSNLAYLPQKVEATLSMQQGENVFAPGFGVRFFEYFKTFRGSPWLDFLLMLDVVRQASIPFTDSILGNAYLPLKCVTRVRGVELISDTVTDHRLPVRVDFDVQGLGRWQRDISVYMPTREQMDERAKLIAESPFRF